MGAVVTDKIQVTIDVLIHLELRTKDLFSFLLDIAAPAAAAWKTKNLNLRYFFSFSEFRVQVSSPLSLSITPLSRDCALIFAFYTNFC
ncbi:hypothetical protein L1887_22452 [Cichorium endivia]|nr:hypothetical protein L1887_22452 [Cichorium endivia]